MNAIAKEKVFEELRNYHKEAFPAKLATDRMDQMKEKFVETEDKIIAMLLSLVNGKSEFVDVSGELDAFQTRIQASSAAVLEQDNQALFTTKIHRLRDILTLAKESNFQLRKIRPKKLAHK